MTQSEQAWLMIRYVEKSQHFLDQVQQLPYQKHYRSLCPFPGIFHVSTEHKSSRYFNQKYPRHLKLKPFSLCFTRLQNEIISINGNSYIIPVTQSRLTLVFYVYIICLSIMNLSSTSSHSISTLLRFDREIETI